MEEMLSTAAALLGLATPSAPPMTQFVLPMSGDAERRVVTYACEGVEQSFAVDYLNASPNFLAVIPVGGERLIFVATISASGARYVSGPFEWLAKGPEATFSDLRQDPPDAVACSELSETP